MKRASLRAKLLAVLGGMAGLALVVIGVALFASSRWQSTAAEIEEHYARSLLLQRIRASTFQALKEVDDGLTGDAVNARGDFNRALRTVPQDFASWRSLADHGGELAEGRRIEVAYKELVSEGRRALDLAAAGRRAEAVRLVDDRLDTSHLERFRRLTELGVASDRKRRRGIQAETARLRRTTQFALLLAVGALVSLVLLLAAYMAQDLFRPLRRTRDALEALARGDLSVRLDADRNDELGEVARAFNAAAETRAAGANDGERPDPLETRALLARLRRELDEPNERNNAIATAAEIEARVRLLTPLAPDLARLDLNALAHDALARGRETLRARAVSAELALDPDLPAAVADHERFAEALSLLMEDALSALPERGGRLGLRTRVDGDRVLLELADDGPADGRRDLEPIATIVTSFGGAAERLSGEGTGSVVRLSLQRCL